MKSSSALSVIVASLVAVAKASSSASASSSSGGEYYGGHHPEQLPQHYGQQQQRAAMHQQEQSSSNESSKQNSDANNASSDNKSLATDPSSTTSSSDDYNPNSNMNTKDFVDYCIDLARATGRISDPYTQVLETYFLENIWNPIIPKEYTTNMSTYLAENETPHAAKLPLMHFFDVALISFCYLFIIFIGQRIMAHLPRFSLKRLTMFHNFCMVTLSAYMFIGIIREAIRCNYNIMRTPIDTTERGWHMSKILWLFYFSKIPEMLDTCIMVLKKNTRQISFLHVYHHVSVFWFQFLTVKIATNGDGYMTAALNSGVHVIMYGYYFLSAAGVKQVAFIKHTITTLQMTQFVYNLWQGGSNWYLGFTAYPIILSKMLLWYMISLLALFGNFLVRDKARLAALRAKENGMAQKKKRS